MGSGGWAGELLRSRGVACASEQGLQRSTLADWLAWLAGIELVGSVSLYGSLAAGQGDGLSDLDVVVEAVPGRWAEAWERRAELVAPLKLAPDLLLEHQWGLVTDSACYAGLTAGGLYVDLVIRRAGGAAKPGEVRLWSRRAGAVLNGAAYLPGPVPLADAGQSSEPAPLIDQHPMDEALAMFWLGALLCSRYIVRGDVWAALDLVGGMRDLFLTAWRLAYDPPRAHYGWTAGIDTELPLYVRRCLARAVPALDRRELSNALWEAASLMDEVGPGLAERACRPYPQSGASLVARLMAGDLGEARLPAQAPSRFIPEVGRDAVVSLREITASTVRAVCLLDVAPDQRHVVAPNARSLAQALFAGERAWYRAIYADEILIGFVMLSVEPEQCEYFLWRLMIDARYQGLGFGRQAMRLLVDHVRSLPGATALKVSYHRGPGGPAEFYRRLGFVETGEVDDDEHIAVLDLRCPGP